MNNVLVIGSGGREHALCWRLMQSPSVKQVFCSPGNGGIADVATCVNLRSPQDIIRFCKEQTIALVVIGPEQPLVEGLADQLSEQGIPVFGPSKEAAQLEGSKGFMKSICAKYRIPTAAYGYFKTLPEAKAFLKDKTYPLVIKADGLAAGKGVVIAASQKEAEEALSGMFAGLFGESGKSVVIEEFLQGEEVSYFALCDGNNAVEFGFAQDHKRVFDGDLGPNTGGMGAYSPAPIMTPPMRETVMQTIILPTLKGMKNEGCPFKGVLFAGLMLTDDGPILLEYNVRFGDPETQALMARFDADLYLALLACSQGGLDKVAISFRKEAALCIVMAANGYPGTYEKGTVIRGIDKANALDDVMVFHAGTEAKDGKILANGGRVLGVTAIGPSIADAQAKGYKGVDLIDWPEGFSRRDIGWRAIQAPAAII
jgi:phosphoribosylamine--glycine ligase